MTIKDLPSLPSTPGVYLFKQGERVLYVGKAGSLRERVRSYFRGTLGDERGERIIQMVALADRLEFRPVDSVLEALLREVDLINELKPPYNILARDDKSFLMVLITKEPWPRVLIKRAREMAGERAKLKAVFGPFPNGQELRLAMKLIRKLFPFRDKCQPGSTQPCFNAQLGLCPGVCAGSISRTDYRRLINYLIGFFRGGKQRVVRQIERMMKAEAKAGNFESAKIWRDRLFGLQHIHDVALLRRTREPSIATPEGTTIRVEAFDIAHLAGGETVGAMVVSHNGEFIKDDYRRFRLRAEKSRQGADTWSLEEVLTRRFNHPEWPAPQLLAVDGGQAQINVARKVLARYGLKIPVVGIVKDAKHRPSRVVGELPNFTSPQELFALNEEAHRYALRYHDLLRRKRMR